MLPSFVLTRPDYLMQRIKRLTKILSLWGDTINL